MVVRRALLSVAHLVPISILLVLHAPPAHAWIDEVTFEGVTYLLQGFPTQVDRYDLAAETFLEPLPLNGLVGDALDVAQTGIYFADGTDVWRMNLDGSELRLLATVSDIVDDVIVDGDLLFVSAASTFWSLDAHSGDVIDSVRGHRHRFRGLSISTGTRTIYARSKGNPFDVVRIAYSEAGALGEEGDSPYHGELPGAYGTWLVGDDLVLDDSGTIVSTDDLSLSGSIGPRVVDAEPFGARILVARDRTLFLYGANFAEIGRFRTKRAAEFVAAHGSNAYAFDARGEVEVVPLEAFELPVAAVPVDPSGTGYAIDEILASADGSVVYILSGEKQAVFRWLPETGTFGASIGLGGAAKRMAYSAERDRLYVAYDDGRLAEIDSQPPFAERQLTGIFPESVFLLAADPYLFFVSNEFYEVFDADGARLGIDVRPFRPTGLAWDAAARRIYASRTGSGVGRTRITPEGNLESEAALPNSKGSYAPVRISENPARLLIGNGQIFDTDSLERLHELAFDPVDAVWRDGSLYTLRPDGADSRIELWDDDYRTAIAVLRVEGVPERMLSLGSQLLIVSRVSGRVQIHLGDVEADSDRDGIPDSTDNCPDAANPDQVDSDSDLAGDICDPYPTDRDDDGVPAEIDNCPGSFNPLQEDRDHDTVGDVCDRYPDAYDHLAACFEEVDTGADVIADLADEVARLREENEALRAITARCPGDVNLDDAVTVDEIVSAVTSALYGCPSGD